MLNSTEHEILIAHKRQNGEKIKSILALNLSTAVFILLINVKMPTIVCISTFISKMNFMLS